MLPSMKNYSMKQYRSISDFFPDHRSEMFIWCFVIQQINSPSTMPHKKHSDCHVLDCTRIQLSFSKTPAELKKMANFPNIKIHRSEMVTHHSINHGLGCLTLVI